MKPSNGVPRFVVVLSTIVLLFSAMGWSADEDKDRSEIEKRIDASAKVLTEVMATPDKAIPNKVLSDAKCLAIIPNMVKIAVGSAVVMEKVSQHAERQMVGALLRQSRLLEAAGVYSSAVRLLIW